MDRTAGTWEAPDLIEPVLGFRQWRLGAGGLRSVHLDQAWTDATLQATCRARSHPRHSAPASGCRCGIYAWYRRVPRLASAATGDLVCGAVVVWGHVELHSTGMRGEFARIAALALPVGRGRKRRRVLEIARALDVPAVPYRAVPVVGRAHGLPVPDRLKPAAAPAGTPPWPGGRRSPRGGSSGVIGLA